jgi:anti-anti-sigma regulatory factor
MFLYPEKHPVVLGDRVLEARKDEQYRGTTFPKKRDITMISRFEKTGSSRVLTFSGELTVEHAGAMRTALIQALTDSDHVEMDFSSVTGVDLSCLQLLCSAHRTSLRSNKRINFVGSQPAKLRETLEAAGYSRVTGCGLDREHSCFWIVR